MQEIAKRVREERRRQGMDQKTLALVADVGVRSVHRIESAQETVRLDILLRVLTALGLGIAITSRRQP